MPFLLEVLCNTRIIRPVLRVHIHRTQPQPPNCRMREECLGADHNSDPRLQITCRTANVIVHYQCPPGESTENQSSSPLGKFETTLQPATQKIRQHFSLAGRNKNMREISFTIHSSTEVEGFGARPRHRSGRLWGKAKARKWKASGRGQGTEVEGFRARLRHRSERLWLFVTMM